jgi:hypothetical protein
MEKDVTGNVTSNQAEDADNNPQPGFWAVIPATVFYDPSIPWGAKVLYSQISNLANLKGYCWASNAYFAKRFATQERTISNWISKLRDAGHITVYFEYFPGSKKIKKRHIRLSIAITKAVKKAIREIEEHADDPEPTSIENFCTTKPVVSGDKNVTANPVGNVPFCSNDSTYSVDVTTDPTDSVVSCASTDKNVTTNPADDSVSIENFFNTNPAVVKIFSPPGGEKIFQENYKDLINKAAAAENQKPPDERSAAAAATAAPSKNETDETGPPDLKQVFLNADPSLIFKQDFYREAAAYLAENGLDVSYVAWIFQQSRKKKPDNLRAMFRALFFEEDLTELFKASFRPSPEPDPVLVSCPACGTHYDGRENRCPHCDLAKDAGPEGIEFHKRLWALSPDRRGEYEKRIKQILFTGHNFEKKQSLLAGLNDEFGLPETG